MTEIIVEIPSCDPNGVLAQIKEFLSYEAYGPDDLCDPDANYFPCEVRDAAWYKRVDVVVGRCREAGIEITDSVLFKIQCHIPQVCIEPPPGYCHMEPEQPLRITPVEAGPRPPGSDHPA